DNALIENALKDPVAGVREQALRLAEERLASSASLRTTVASLADDDAPRVRFQLAFTLGESDAPELVASLAKVARRSLDDTRWTQTAVLSSAGKIAPGLLEALTRDKEFTQKPTPAHLQLLTRLASLAATRPGDADLGRTLKLLAVEGKTSPAVWQV